MPTSADRRLPLSLPHIPSAILSFTLAFTALAILTARPAGAVVGSIQTAEPSSASQGTNNLLVTFTLSPTPPPPTNLAVQATSVTIGTISGSSITRPSQFVVTARFNIPGAEEPGTKNVLITYQGTFTAAKTNGFTVTPASSLTADFAATPRSGAAPLTVLFSDASTGTVTNRLWDFGDETTGTDTNPSHIYNLPGSYPVSLTVRGPLGSNTMTRAGYITVNAPPTNGAYAIVDTGQTSCYATTSTTISPPLPGQPYYGQDAQCIGRQPSYRDNGDGTVSDLNTGLMWVKARGEAVAWQSAVTNAANCRVGGYADWRMPTIKELYSLVLFTGANGQSFTNTIGYIPFIDTNYFGFAYGPGTSTNTGSRVIDAQDWSANSYVSTVMNGQAATFGFNFTDGRIKGYPPANSNYVRYVRGNTAYGVNAFVNNGDGTITDRATGLMWSRNDSGAGMNWSNALAWAQAMNASNHLGHGDWRLPNAKELQSIMDYTRSPATTASAAINPVFNCTAITNEGGAADFPFYWSGTTLLAGPTMAEGVYLCFGRAMGYMLSAWLDVHGAGAQRSDLKVGSASSFPFGRGPQGDAVRIDNFVRLVRDAPATTSWRFAFVGDTHVPSTMTAAEIASAVVGDDVKLLIVDGDLAEGGAGASAASLQSQLTTWRNAMAPAVANGIGLYVTRGNHEDDVTNNLPVWNTIFSGSYAMPTNGPAGETNLTYSLTCNNALFVGLDNYINIHRVNQPWMNGVLAANRLPHVFVFGHEAAFKGFHTDCLDDYPDERNTFWQSLSNYGARVYLCGHDHFLNVARIDDGDGNVSNDLYQFEVGTGGATNWPPQRYSYNGDNSPYTPVNMTSVTNTYGYLLVEVSGSGSNDLGVTLTWKQRTYDTNTDSYIYVAASNLLSYTAVDPMADSVGDGLPNWWRREHFGGDGTTTNNSASANNDPDGDGLDNIQEYMADTDPFSSNSLLRIREVSSITNGVRISWEGGTGSTQLVEYRHSLTDTNESWTPLVTNLPPTDATNSTVHTAATDATNLFYRIEARRSL
jgi:PKD repeat protein